jgi:hypothetical protein
MPQRPRCFPDEKWRFGQVLYFVGVPKLRISNTPALAGQALERHHRGTVRTRSGVDRPISRQEGGPYENKGVIRIVEAPPDHIAKNEFMGNPPGTKGYMK